MRRLSDLTRVSSALPDSLTTARRKMVFLKKWIERGWQPRMSTFRERIENANSLMFDEWIVSNGFAPYDRDYQLVIEIWRTMEDSSGTGYMAASYRYRFTHCPEVRVTKGGRNLDYDEYAWWSWEDEFIDYDEWVRAGEPNGYCWWQPALGYPGMSNVADSTLAASWSERMGRKMHEICIETNRYQIHLICHDLIVVQLAKGDPMTGEVASVDLPYL
jgi:hypothetical protein